MTIRFEKLKLNNKELALLKETLYSLEDNREYYFYNVKEREDADKLTSFLTKNNIPFEIETIIK